jgi:glycerol-3-phosphate acyltransferase PlsX
MANARIALDAFGGDRCPGPEVEGALRAVRDGGVEVILVGDETALKSALDAQAPDWSSLPLRIHHAPDVITMEDSPSKAVRGKPNASMPQCFELVKKGEADAAMSAGNSGAMLACGLFKYRRIKGVDRPALVTSTPTREGGFTTFLDVGANVECKPINLVQFAVLGAVYSSFKHGTDTPRVGLLSNGSEEGKGTELTRTAHQLLREHESDAFDYRGYAEGADLFNSSVDVMVADGFSGNIALKVMEATGRTIGGWLKDAIGSSTRAKMGALLMKPALLGLRAALDPDSYGAAPLLGVRGLAFICHGAASPNAIARSLELAARSVSEKLAPQLEAAVQNHKPLFEAAKAAEHAS